MNLTVVILAYHEEEFIEDAVLSARQITDNVLVLDSGSRDGTAAIARHAGARVAHRTFAGFANQRQAALDLVETEWTLFLDADERLPASLVAEIEETLAGAEASVAGYWIPRRNIALGRILEGGGWWPDYQLRLLRTRRATYAQSQQVHEVAEIDGDAFSLAYPMIHINYVSVLEFIRKQWDYAEQSVDNGAPRPRRRAYLSAPAREFWRRFIELRGYRDGVTGVFMAAVMAGASWRTVWLQRRRATSPNGPTR